MTSLAESHSRAENDRDAERLFARHANEVLRHCLRQLGSRTDAEDAVQTTFLNALRALRRGEAPESEIAWLIAIATNVCRSQRRTLARRSRVADSVDLDALPERQHEGRDVLMALPSALASIPESQRRALLLSEWRGLPAREVAVLLGMSATATHALLTRARKSLAQALATPRALAVHVLGLVVQLRSQLAAWLGGAAGKTAAAGVVAIAVAAGGLTTQLGGEPEPRRPQPSIAPAQGGGSESAPAGPIAQAPGAHRRPREVAGRARDRVARTPPSGETVVGNTAIEQPAVTPTLTSPTTEGPGVGAPTSSPPAPPGSPHASTVEAARSEPAAPSADVVVDVSEAPIVGDVLDEIGADLPRVTVDGVTDAPDLSEVEVKVDGPPLETADLPTDALVDDVDELLPTDTLPDGSKKLLP